MTAVWSMVCAAVMVACASSPRQVSSPAKLPARFTSSDGPRLPDRWWESFDDQDLNRLVKEALEASFTLRQAWDRLAQAKALARKVGAGMLPDLDAQAGAKAGWSKQGAALGWNVGLVATYEVDLWGRVRSERAAERFAVLATREDLSTAAISLSAEVTLCWFQLLERRAQLSLLRAQRELSVQVLDGVMLRFGVGQASAADVLQQRQSVESLAGDESGVRGQIGVLENQLAVLLGKAPGTFVAPVRDSLPSLGPLPGAGVPAALLARRPDVRGALRRVEEADQRVGAALADRWPRLSLSATIGASGTYGPPALWTWLANLAANLVAPLFDGGSRRAEVERVRAKASEALNKYAQVVLTAIKEVEDALGRERESTRQVESLERQLRLSGQVVGQLRAAYLQGAEEYPRVLDVLIRHQLLERALLAARRERLEHRVALCRGLAGAFPIPAPGKAASRQDPEDAPGRASGRAPGRAPGREPGRALASSGRRIP
ncbi:MAG: TolC family protein [Polyangia bacterium]|nr:TolC family protein [Polyangia bacterium]